MDALEAYNQWLIKYKSNLNIIKNDLDLIINKNFNIFFAVDFHDIYDYCFPFYSYYKSIDNNKLKEYFDLQLSRSILFFMLDNIYAKPILLLPPYLRETNDFLEYLQSHAGKFTDDKFKKILLSKIGISDASYYLNNSKSVNREKLLELLGSKTIDIAGFFVMGLSSGLYMYLNLMNNHISVSPAFLDNLILRPSNIANDFDLSLYDSILEDDNRDLEIIVSNVRDDEQKQHQNRRDAEALRYIIELNDLLSRSNAAIFLISSAPHMIRLQNSPLINKDIGGNHLTLLRDPSFLLTMIQEIASLFRCRTAKLSLKDIDFKDLMSVVDSDLIKLDTFLLNSNDFSTLSGNFRESVVIDSLKGIIDLSDRLDNMDLALLIDQFLPKVDNSLILKPDNIERNIIKSLTELSKLLERIDFTEKIFEKITELEKARLEYFWDITKERNIINLMFPFNLFLKNINYKKSIDEIINLIVEGQLSFKEERKVSKELLDDLHFKLKTLSKYEYLDKHDEKYLLWIIIFLILDRSDLVEMWYKQFINKISERHIKRELTYIYVKSLTDSLIKKGGLNINIIDVINLCYNYGEFHYPQHSDIVNFDFQKISQENIKKILKNLNIDLIEGVDAIRLSEFAWAIKIEEPYYIIFYENEGSGIQVISVDVRFIHLILAAIAEYQNNYSINSETINEVINKLEDIYLPLVQNLEHGYRVPLFSNYAYFLAQLFKRNQSIHYLFRAFEFIKIIENDSDALYWNYYEYYIASIIYCELAQNSTGVIKKRYRSMALYNLDKANESLPNRAKKLKDDIDELKLICNCI